MAEKTSPFGRDVLLYGPKRNEILTLEEVEQYGFDGFGDRAYVRLYGMAPHEWYPRGIRLLGRTTVECTRDSLARLISVDVAALAARMPMKGRLVVIDLFAGSCNTLYWLVNHLPNAEGIGFELDARVFLISKANITALNSQLNLLEGDWGALLKSVSPDENGSLIVFVAPPWGKALDEVSGLDLRHTSPPVPEIIAAITRTHAGPLLIATQLYEKTNPQSLAAVRRSLDWSQVRTYDIDTTGRNHGILLGAKNWRP